MASREVRAHPRSALAGFFLCGAAIVGALDAHAQSSKTKFLGETLRKDPDHRVRIDAALKLGTSDDPDAVKPLCACLSDTSEVELVRVSCAAALGKLNKPGCADCLTKNANDSAVKVRNQVASALKGVGGSTAPAPAVAIKCKEAPGVGAPKYYVAIAFSNKTKRPDAEIFTILREEFVCKLRTFGRFKIADDSDTKAMAKVIAKEKLDGYFVTLTVEPPKVEGKLLRMSVKLMIMTHTRDLKGELGKQLAASGAPTAATEDELLRLGSAKLAEDFASSKP